MITAGKDCRDCKHCTFDNMKVHCAARDKQYVYGMKVPCEDKEEKDDGAVGKNN